MSSVKQKKVEINRSHSTYIKHLIDSRDKVNSRLLLLGLLEDDYHDANQLGDKQHRDHTGFDYYE